MFPLRDVNRSSTRPVVMYALVAINVAVFLYEVTLSPRQLNLLFMSFGSVPASFEGPGGGFAPSPPALFDLFSSMFLHGGWLHIIFNMWYLWIFGDNVEDRMGHWRFLLFYLLGGIVAGFANIALNWGSPVPSIGASGAIAAVLGAYLVLFPRARILTIVPIFFLWVLELPAIFVLGLWFVVQIISGVGSFGGAHAGGVAYWAHIGGFLFGLLTVYLFTQRRLPQRPVIRQEPWWQT